MTFSSTSLSYSLSETLKSLVQSALSDALPASCKAMKFNVHEKVHQQKTTATPHTLVPFVNHEKLIFEEMGTQEQTQIQTEATKYFTKDWKGIVATYA